MKVIIIKHNEKTAFVAKIDDITTKQFLDLQREAKKNIEKKDNFICHLENEIVRLNAYCDELNNKINYLGKQIAIDRGEIEEDSQEEYVIQIVKKEEIKIEPELEPSLNEEEPEPQSAEPIEEESEEQE